MTAIIRHRPSWGMETGPRDTDSTNNSCVVVSRARSCDEAAVGVMPPLRAPVESIPKPLEAGAPSWVGLLTAYHNSLRGREVEGSDREQTGDVRDGRCFMTLPRSGLVQ